MKEYTKPILKKWGSIAEITLGNSGGSNPDGGAGGHWDQPGLTGFNNGSGP